MPFFSNVPGTWWRTTACGCMLLVLATACSAVPAPDSAAPRAVTVQHSGGDTTVAVGPERIVALSTSWADTVLAFGIDPVAVGTLTGFAPNKGIYPWQKQYDPATITLSLFGDPDFEAIAAAEPDLILADFSARDSRIYERLSRIAPTIAPLRDHGYVDPWRDQVQVLGEILDEPAEAATLTATTETRVAVTRQHFPCLAGNTFALATLTPDAIGVVADPADPAAEMFAELGMQLNPAVTALADRRSRLTISYEEAAALADTDLILIRDRGRSELPVSPTGETMTLDGSVATALSDPSALNIGFVLDALAPAMRAMCGL